MDSTSGNLSLPHLTPLTEDMNFVVETMREISRISDPQRLVQVYGASVRKVIEVDANISLSRRNLPRPKYKITRSSLWQTAVNPWREQHKLPIFDSGLLSELIYRNEPTVIDDLQVSPDDPAAEYFAGMKSLAAIPMFEGGEAINMVVVMRKVRNGFPPERLPMQVWMTNLFGRATHNLVLSQEVKAAYDIVERELKAVADIQRSLLPAELPAIDGLELAVHYQTSRHSGGDYYDFFKLPHGQWGILLADVSGHGTPAAVLMAIVHSIAHVACNPPAPPASMLAAINSRLVLTYTGENGNFVTAFYGVYDPVRRTLVWSNAGHPPPRLRRADGTVSALPLAQSLPLGIEADEPYGDRITQLSAGDSLLFYTDGITEARNRACELFEVDRLDNVLRLDPGSAPQMIAATLEAVESFAGGEAASDDRTLLALRVE
ncbi:MAG TPA: PP2C family protein-serine/threonine phosphatase [Tepidisphaeraceae bacterium]|jgi:sigma-B regulation protein RsbU (phosphoserine phosphatase)|nr:PP2C family protein-serine/threonine phosphatase [Tepidisphaeraceae bacterium]